MLPQPTTSSDNRSKSGCIAKSALNAGSVGQRGYLVVFESLKYSPESSLSRFLLGDGDHNGGAPGTRIVGYFG